MTGKGKEAQFMGGTIRRRPTFRIVSLSVHARTHTLVSIPFPENVVGTE
jgi:hypothetical protein